MKTLIKLVAASLMLVVVSSLSAHSQDKKVKDKSKTEVVCYTADIHCGGCKAKIESNIAFEKGVKDIVVDMKGNKVTVTFLKSKNDKESIRKAIEKLDIKITDVQVVK